MYISFYSLYRYLCLGSPLVFCKCPPTTCRCVLMQWCVPFLCSSRPSHEGYNSLDPQLIKHEKTSFKYINKSNHRVKTTVLMVPYKALPNSHCFCKHLL